MGSFCCYDRKEEEDQNYDSLSEDTEEERLVSEYDENDKDAKDKDYLCELVYRHQSLFDPKRRKKGNKRLSRKSQEIELLKSNNVDETETFEFTFELRNFSSFVNKELKISFFKLDLEDSDFFLEESLDPVVVTKQDAGNVKLKGSFRTKYEYFDYQLIKFELEANEKEKYSVILNPFKIFRRINHPIKVAIDAQRPGRFQPQDEKETKDPLGSFIQINIKRATRVLEQTIHTFFVEFDFFEKLAKSSVTKKLQYKLWKSYEGKNSELLYESNIVADKQRFIFNLAFIKQNSFIDAKSNEDAIICFEFIESDKHLGEIKLMQSEILRCKLNEVKILPLNSQPYMFENKRTIEKNKASAVNNIGRMKMIYKELYTKRLFDHVCDGLKFKFSIGVEFSGFKDSNEFYRYHNTVPELNAYFKILSIFRNLFYVYDFEDTYNALGFGGMSIYDKKMHLACNLNGKNNDKEPFKIGMDEIMDGYLSRLKTTVYSTHCQMRKVLTSFIEVVKSRNNHKEYHLIFLLISGQPEDLQDTKDLLFESSKLPISVILIGLREKENKEKQKFGYFSKLENEDSSKVQLINSKGEVRPRNNLHFVEVNINKKKLNSSLLSCFENVSIQIEDYYKMQSQLHGK